MHLDFLVKIQNSPEKYCLSFDVFLVYDHEFQNVVGELRRYQTWALSFLSTTNGCKRP